MNLTAPVPRPGEVPAWLVAVMNYLAAAYPAWKPEPATFVVYYDVLRDLPRQSVEAAARAFVRQPSEFAPTAGQMRQKALEHRREVRAHEEDCPCLACINAAPLAQRWLRMSPAMRTMLERDNPALADELKAAVPESVSRRAAPPPCARRASGRSRACGRPRPASARPSGGRP